MPDVPLSLPGQRQRYRQNSDVATAGLPRHLPHVPIHGRLAPNNPQDQSYPSYDGDRILVAKFPYEFANPKRWDIIVFKYPDDATMNYIKRLVGLPGETIRIHDGDLWIRNRANRRAILRSPASRRKNCWPCSSPSTTTIWRRRSRAPCTGRLVGRRAGSETFVDHARTRTRTFRFEIEGSAKGEAWIRYRHRVPTPEQWQRIATTADKQSEDLTPAEG